MARWACPALLLMRLCAFAALLVLRSGPAIAIDVANPNMSRDAAQCQKLTAQFRQAMASRTNDLSLADTKKTGERGAFLCRMDRYREGITMLERALTTLGEGPK